MPTLIDMYISEEKRKPLVQQPRQSSSTIVTDYNNCNNNDEANRAFKLVGNRSSVTRVKSYDNAIERRQQCAMVREAKPRPSILTNTHRQSYSNDFELKERYGVIECTSLTGNRSEPRKYFTVVNLKGEEPNVDRVED